VSADPLTLRDTTQRGLLPHESVPIKVKGNIKRKKNQKASFLEKFAGMPKKK
jgi:hypothetical protein